jgi:hypothetical protein
MVFQILIKLGWNLFSTLDSSQNWKIKKYLEPPKSPSSDLNNFMDILTYHDFINHDMLEYLNLSGNVFNNRTVLIVAIFK